MPEQKNILMIGGASLAGIVSILTLYSTLATESWVNNRIDEKLTQAPITVEAKMRIQPIEHDMKEVKNSINSISDTLNDMRVELGIIARGVELHGEVISGKD